MWDTAARRGKAGLWENDRVEIDGAYDPEAVPEGEREAGVRAFIFGQACVAARHVSGGDRLREEGLDCYHNSSAFCFAGHKVLV